MNPLIKNSLAVIAGIVLGGLLNMSIIQISGKIIPPPEGADLTTAEGLKSAMSLMEPKHFILPFLAHALGTLLGAWIASKFAASRPYRQAMIVGIVFMLGGITAIFILPAPTWFLITDLVLAYIPMALLGAKLSGK
jgi:hypothetical protein